MTHLKTKRAFLAAGAFFAAGLILWPGCATPPLPASRTPISPLKRADFSFVKEANPTRDDVIAKLGQPDEYFPDLRVAISRLPATKLEFLSSSRLKNERSPAVAVWTANR